MRILVTGGAGFLGSHICERLLNDGHSVACLDNLSTGSTGSVAHLLDSDRFSLIRQDVMTPQSIEVDQIYHFACPASPRSYQQQPITTAKTSILGTLNMLELAMHGKARFLLASTSEIYGDPQVSPQHEDYWGHVNPIGLRSCYNEGKRAAESLVFDHIRHHGMEAKIVRIFNTYGPRMLPDDGRVVSNFIVQALTGQDLTIYGSGAQTRSFCFVDDTVEAVVRMMTTPGEVTGPINVGNPSELSVKELAEMVIDLTGTRSRLVFMPMPSDDPKKRQPDITRARAALDWQPTVPLRAGLLRTIAFFETVLNGGSRLTAAAMTGN